MQAHVSDPTVPLPVDDGLIGGAILEIVKSHQPHVLAFRWVAPHFFLRWLLCSQTNRVPSEQTENEGYVENKSRNRLYRHRRFPPMLLPAAMSGTLWIKDIQGLPALQNTFGTVVLYLSQAHRRPREGRRNDAGLWPRLQLSLSGAKARAKFSSSYGTAIADQLEIARVKNCTHSSVLFVTVKIKQESLTRYLLGTLLPPRLGRPKEMFVRDYTR